jgi:3-polyprenyl-4-hydroxybenzoate decarboxylase
MNVHGSWPNHALALGIDKKTSLRNQFFEFVRRYQQYPGGLERVTSAPWQEMVVGKDVNLFDLMPLGYAKIVIVVDAHVDPFDLKQVMWAMSVKVNPAGDVIILPNLRRDAHSPGKAPRRRHKDKRAEDCHRNVGRTTRNRQRDPYHRCGYIGPDRGAARRREWFHVHAGAW